MKISYSESLQLRGLAILMMIWLHCFNKDVTGLTYISLLPSVGGATLPFLLTRVAQICVSLYCFLSGYGLYCKYPYKEGYTRKKAFILIKQYWFVLFTFAIVGIMMKYYHTVTIYDLLGNFLGYRTSWNSTLWFLLPYIILLLISKWVFEFINKLKIYISLPIIIVAWVFAMGLLKYQNTGVIEINVFVKNLLQVLRLLLPFCFGVYAKKYDYIEDVIKANKSLWWGIMFLSTILLMSRFLIWNHFTLPVCCVAFVYLFHCVKLSSKLRDIISFFGEKSLYLWFCHAYFVYYFFKEYVLGVKYAILIYLLAIVLSLFSALFFEYSFRKLKF